MSHEVPLAFACNGESLVGILHLPDRPRRIGVVIVVGGPQYRVGSHRQFTLLARYLAERGYAVLRFDCRGMGDSGGEFPGFEGISADIAAAVDLLFRQTTGVEQVALWGLCDAASAALMYASGDRRVAGMALLNPWVRSDATLAKTYLRHYYLARLMSREFWSKLFAGELRAGRVVGDLAGNIRAGTGPSAQPQRQDFVSRMRHGLENFGRPVLIVLSGNDITAAEFAGVAESTDWRHLLQRPGITRHGIAEANHTFSTAAWRDEVAGLTAGWLDALEKRG
jgi:uncharacterized protein